MFGNVCFSACLISKAVWTLHALVVALRLARLLWMGSLVPRPPSQLYCIVKTRLIFHFYKPAGYCHINESQSKLNVAGDGMGQIV